MPLRRRRAILARSVGKTGKRRSLREAPPVGATQGLAGAATGRMWGRHGWRLLGLAGLLLLAYSNSFQAALVFDNASVIGEDPRIRGGAPENIESILKGRYWYGESARPATSPWYRPFTTFTYLVNYAVLGNGPRPEGYHWVNLALHEFDVALVYALGLLIFGEAAPAFALAAIWGLHPLLTEAVTNIVGRAELLAAFGVLAGLLCHVKGASAAGWRRVAWLAGLAAAQAVGLFSKENGAVLPGIMLLYDLTWPERATWRRRAAAYAVVALPIAAYLYLRSGAHIHMVVEFTENPLVSAGFWTTRLTAIKVIGKYLWLFVWPARLSADYTYNTVELFGWRLWNWEDAQALIALAICLAAALLAVLLAVRWRRTGRPLFFFLVFFFVALAPASNVFILGGSTMAERFLYLPSVGLAGCVVAAVCALGRRRWLKPPAAARVAWAALGLVCLAFAARTYARNFDWRDERSLWASTVAVCPGSVRAHYSLGLALERDPDRLPEAIAEYETALQIQPDFVEAHNNLANALARLPGRMRRRLPNTRRRCGFNPAARRFTTIWQQPWRRRPAGCRRRLPSTRRRCGFGPITRKRTTPWRTPWRRRPAGCRRRLPNTRRRCGWSPAARTFTTTWQTPWRRRPAGCRKRLPNTGRRCGLSPIFWKRASTLRPRWRGCPAGCRRRLPSMKRSCGSGPIRSCSKPSTVYGLI